MHLQWTTTLIKVDSLPADMDDLTHAESSEKTAANELCPLLCDLRYLAAPVRLDDFEHVRSGKDSVLSQQENT
ncbi:hypothetical protein EES42_35945 [Streptomyces sp. ADI95-17]|nr:hypothetical protein EES42_35945 [Streptomyces sp. ADI95-17]